MKLKRRNNSWLWVVGIVLVVLILIAIFGSTGNDVSGKEVVKIGVTLPLTGDVAFLGIPDKNALELAKEEFASDAKYDYQLVIEDDAYDPKRVASNMQKFVDVDDVDVVLTFGSTPANVVAPLAEENKIVFIATSASDLSVADGKYGFDFATTPQVEAEKMAKELNDRGYKKLAIAKINLEAFDSMLNSLRNEIAKYGIEIVSEEYFNPGTTDFNTAILKLQDANPDIIVVLTQSPTLELFAKQYNNLNVDIPLTAIESFGITEEKGLFEGSWYVDAGYPDEEFFTKYKEIYGEDPTTFSADIYSTFHLIVEAYESFDEKPSSDEVIEKLMSIQDFDTPLGKVSANEKGVFESPATVKEIKDGEAVLIG